MAKRMGIYNRGVNGIKQNAAPAKAKSKIVAFNDKLTLRKLLTMITPTKGASIPTRKALKASYEPIAVYCTRNFCLSIYENGFALAEAWKRYAVFRVDRCKEYHYDTKHENLANQRNSATKPDITFEEFLDEPWTVRLLLTAEDKLEENNDMAARRAISEHPSIASDVQQYNRYVHGESVDNLVLRKMCTLEALNTLTDRQKEAMILYHVEGYTQQEIGRMLGISTTAARDRINAGINRIRKYLYEMED